ncbi:MAG: ArsR family transcriptional regulator [Microgenomates group bacterium GW2011_GWC1_43_13]|nr:MAG: ArsR family transcriptional regulator [Microgenomates group bacterium GW2011_GWC1_43_13]
MKILKPPYSKTVYKNTAELFEAMASPKRLEILNLLKTQDMSVTQIAKAMGIRVANVSQHLMALRYLKLVKRKGTGKSVTYKIAKPEILEPFMTFNKLIKRG